MTLNSSGPISLGGSTAGQSVNLELGQSATAQISFNDANVRTLTGTSSGSTLVMPTNFYGKSSVVVNFNDRYIYAGNTGATAVAGYQIKTDGFDYEGVNGAFSAIAQWVTPTSAASNYEVFATVTSGSLTSGTTGSWVAVSSNPTWTRNRTSVGLVTAIMSMQIREIGTTTVLDTWTVQLDAERI